MSGRGELDIRMVLTDVDGTLITAEGKLTDAVIRAAADLHRAGIVLAVTSSRPPRGMSMLVEPLGLTSVMAGFNGGVMVYPDQSEIESHPLDPLTARRTLDLILEQGLDAWVYSGPEWLVRDRTAPHVARESRTVRFEPNIVPSFTDAELARAVKIVGVSDDFELVASCGRSLRHSLGNNVSATNSRPYYLDVTNPQANKGEVVITLSKLLNIPLAQIATIGDGSNDVLMFERSGFSIAMGNASDEVKASASAVTEDNENSGFAYAMKKFVLQY